MKVTIYIDGHRAEDGVYMEHAVVKIPGMMDYHFWFPRSIGNHDNFIIAKALGHVSYCMLHHKLSYKDVFPLEYEIL